MAKCGTGTLGFLDCHPNIAFRGTEPRYFLDESTNEAIIRAWRTKDKSKLHILRHRYTNRLPRAARDEYLIEKSPQYIGGETYDGMVKRAWAMKILNPKLKIIIVTCDPIKQMYSQFRMQERRAADYKAKGTSLKRCSACLKQPMKDQMKEWSIKVSRCHRSRKGMCSADFFHQMAPWRRVFKDRNIFIMDGERMAQNAGEEIEKLLEFLEVPQQTFSFENQRNKGFSCLQHPLPFCLNPAKGTSRKTDVYKLYPQ